MADIVSPPAVIKEIVQDVEVLTIAGKLQNTLRKHDKLRMTAKELIIEYAATPEFPHPETITINRAHIVAVNIRRRPMEFAQVGGQSASSTGTEGGTSRWSDT